jgi:hypothetical protein
MPIWETIETLQNIAEALAAGRGNQAMAITCAAMLKAQDQLQAYESAMEAREEERQLERACQLTMGRAALQELWEN